MNAGEYLAFKIGPDGMKHLAYRNDTRDSLEWARYYGPGAGAYPFHVEEIEGIGVGGHPSGIAIETDANADPIIVYRKADTTFEDLRIARPRGAVP